MEEKSIRHGTSKVLGNPLISVRFQFHQLEEILQKQHRVILILPLSESFWLSELKGSWWSRAAINDD